MRSVFVAGLMGGVVLVASMAGAGAQPSHGAGLSGGLAIVPVADYPEPRFRYGDPPPPRDYDPDERRREGFYRPRPGYDGPPPGRFDPEDDDRPRPEGYGPRHGRFDAPHQGYAFAPEPRPRCWIRPGYDGPERVCRW